MKAGNLKKLAIVTTHPIQYNAPMFRMLSERGVIKIKVFYTWSQLEKESKFDPGFGKNVDWDVPLLTGYEFQFIKNTSSNPGSHHFKGIINPTLVDDIREWGAEAVLVYGWSFQSHLKCIRHFHKKIPVLFRGDSTLMRKQPLLKKLFRTVFLKWVYRHTDIAFYVGESNKKYFLKHGLRKSQLVFAPHAVDNERFADNDGRYTKAAQAWLKKMGVNPQHLVIVFAGKIETIKDPFFILSLAKEASGLPVTFIIIGNGHLESGLKEKARGYNNIYFEDFQNQSMMPVVYRLGDFFILPSVSETWGLSVNEAMASGRAILVNENVGCAVDLVQNGKNGFIFKSGNVTEVLQHLTAFLSKPENAADYGRQSLKIIQAWSYENVCKAIEEVIIKVNSSAQLN